MLRKKLVKSKYLLMLLISITVLSLVSVTSSSASIPSTEINTSITPSWIPPTGNQPIILHGDEQVSALASEGSGTTNDPYIIENKYIIPSEFIMDKYRDPYIFGGGEIVTTWFVAGLSVKDTTVHVTFRNIEVEFHEYAVFIPFFFENNEHIVLENIIASGGRYDTYIRGNFDDPYTPIIKGDYIINEFSFDGWQTEQEGCIFTNHIGSLELYDGLINNEVFAYRKGTAFHDTPFVKMRDIAFTGCGMGHALGTYDLNYDIDESNTVDGKPIIYKVSENGLRFKSSDVIGQLVLLDCHDVSIKGLKIEGGSFPITAFFSTDILIKEVEILGANFDAIIISGIKNVRIEKSSIHTNIRSGILVGEVPSLDPADSVVIEKNKIWNCARPLRLVLSSNVRIIDNLIYFTDDLVEYIREQTPEGVPVELYGIQLMTSNNILIEGNYIVSCTQAIRTDVFYTAPYAYGNVTIRANGMTNARYGDGCGVELFRGLGYAIVENNVVEGFWMGIFLEGQSLSITGNNVVNCTKSIDSFGYEPSVAYGNNFINYNDQLIDTILSGQIVLDNGIHGNYWSDYEIKYPTATNDGTIWDIPYDVLWNNKDNYPLVNPMIDGDKISLTNKLATMSRLVSKEFEPYLLILT